MTAFLAAIPARLWTWLAAIGAGLLVLARLLASARQSERDRIAARAAERAAEERDTRDAIDRAVARDPDPAAELRRDWRRGL